MSKHEYVKLDKLTSKGFTGSEIKKFIHKGGTKFPAISKPSEKVAAGHRGGKKQSTTGGVSTKTGYRDRQPKAYKAAPGDI